MKCFAITINVTGVDEKIAVIAESISQAVSLIQTKTSVEITHYRQTLYISSKRRIVGDVKLVSGLVID